MSGPAGASAVGEAPASATTVADAVQGHANTTSADHRRNRNSWSEEDKKAFWRLKRAERRLRKKERAAQRQEEMRAEWDVLPEGERERRKAAAAFAHERRRDADEAHAARSWASLRDPRTPALVFDLSFAWCMTPADTRSAIAQLKFSYSTLRAASFPFRPVLTSLIGKEPDDSDAAHDATAQAALLAELNSFEGFAKFPPQILSTGHWSRVFPAGQVVFLTADADEVLTDIEPDTAYIIGAFVDHNRYKGLSRAAAERHGVRMARLPIKESIELGNRCLVLTINHVVDVLTRFMQSKAAGGGNSTVTGDWRTALEASLPGRRVTQGELRSRKRRRRRTAEGGGSEASGQSAEGTGECLAGE